jgi:hypothetical protein
MRTMYNLVQLLTEQIHFLEHPKAKSFHVGREEKEVGYSLWRL